MHVAWKQRITAFPGNDTGIFDAFEKLFMAHGGPPDFALFSRTTENFENEVFLLSPASAAWAPLLGGDWAEATDFAEYRWIHLIGHDGIGRRLGLESGTGKVGD
jgi:hypothetical protein